MTLGCSLNWCWVLTGLLGSGVTFAGWLVGCCCDKLFLIKSDGPCFGIFCGGSGMTIVGLGFGFTWTGDWCLCCKFSVWFGEFCVGDSVLSLKSESRR